MVQIDPFAPQYFPVQPEGALVGVAVGLLVGVLVAVGLGVEVGLGLQLEPEQP